jgi:hypothetical protein
VGSLTLAEQHHLLEHKTRGLIFLVLERHFWWLQGEGKDEAIANGWLGATKAAAKFDPSTGCKWSGYAFRGIRNEINVALNRERKNPFVITFGVLTGNFDMSCEGRGSSRLEPLNPRQRHLPPGKAKCFGCKNLHAEGFVPRSRNLCDTCDRARLRAKARFGGEGVCACGRIMRSRFRRLLYGTGKRFSVMHCDCGDPYLAQGEVQPQAPRGARS